MLCLYCVVKLYLYYDVKFVRDVQICVVMYRVNCN